MDEELLPTSEQRKWFVEVGSTPGEGAAKTVEMTTKGLEYRISFVHRAARGFGRFDPTTVKVLWVEAIRQHCRLPRKFHEGKSQSMPQTSLLFEEVATATLTFSNCRPVQSAAMTGKKILSCRKLR